MFEASRIVALYNGFLDFKKVDNSEYAVVVRKQSFRLNPRLHQHISFFSVLDMKFNLQCLSVGKTSTTFETRLCDDTTGEELAVNKVRIVRMSRKTRTSAEYPEFYYEKYRPFIGQPTTKFLESRGIPSMPDDSYLFKLQVRSSDTDKNGHTNQASYVMFCMDCATDAALKKYYRHFDSDMCMYTTTYWEIDYLGESRTGDVLDIYTWQSNDNIGNIHFSIRLKRREIFNASTIFDLQKQISPAKRNARM